MAFSLSLSSSSSAMLSFRPNEDRRIGAASSRFIVLWHLLIILYPSADFSLVMTGPEENLILAVVQEVFLWRPDSRQSRLEKGQGFHHRSCEECAENGSKNCPSAPMEVPSCSFINQQFSSLPCAISHNFFEFHQIRGDRTRRRVSSNELRADSVELLMSYEPSFF